jgi:putative PIN family toxin of toxin-antitoxin system
MHKVIIDSNVFISGLLFGGVPEKILQSWMKNQFILCISPQLQAELINKLRYKFRATEDFTNNLLANFDGHAKRFTPHTNISLVRDPNDNFLLELAEEAHADYLITGDKDLLALKSYKRTNILSPDKYLQLHSIF